MTEDELLTGLMDALAAGGWLAVHHRRSDLAIIQGRVGWPDIAAVHAGRRLFVVIECKTERGRVDPEQERWLSALQDAGVDARIVRPSDYDTIVEWLLGDRLIRRLRGRRR